MKKSNLPLFFISMLFLGLTSKAQLVDEQNVTITMDLQPILQLDMSGPQNIDFVFDEVYEYVGGITKYGVTQLKVSASVDWDLYAVGYSSGMNGNALLWDNQVTYGIGAATNASNALDCELLELRQNKANSSCLTWVSNHLQHMWNARDNEKKSRLHRQTGFHINSVINDYFLLSAISFSACFT